MNVKLYLWVLNIQMKNIMNQLIFFKKFVQTIDEPLEMIKNNRYNNATENNNDNDNNSIPNKPEINETAAKPIVS